jgi:hypothetical protein
MPRKKKPAVKAPAPAKLAPKNRRPTRKAPAQDARTTTARSPRKPGAAARRASAATAAVDILAWDNDPFAEAVPSLHPSTGTPLPRPVPSIGGGGPFGVDIVAGTAPQPGRYAVGSPEFRYWTAAEAMRRAVDFWTPLVPAAQRKWFPSVGPSLRAFLDQDTPDLNAYYDREGLKFFHSSAGGQLVYSGESPDVVCHEFGHAVLDVLRPQLFDAGSTEAAAFHEAFGDISAILCALQLPSVRERVLAETGGTLYHSSRLSRLCEQLGWAIRQRNPAAAEPDCLRNAVNSFFYQDPASLPPSAPAGMISSEPHSFSRVFSAAFFEGMSGMLEAEAAPTSDTLLSVSKQAASFLVSGVLAASVVPSYFSQVAAAMLHAMSGAGEKYRSAFSGAFVRHGVLSLSTAANPAATVTITGAGAAAARVLAAVAVAPAAHAAQGEGAGLPTLPVSTTEYGFGEEIASVLIHAATQPRRFQAASAAPDLGSLQAPAPDRAAKSFLEDLLRLGRIDFAATEVLASVAREHPFAQPLARKTHGLFKTETGVTLRRMRFDCGFDCGCARR